MKLDGVVSVIGGNLICRLCQVWANVLLEFAADTTSWTSCAEAAAGKPVTPIIPSEFLTPRKVPGNPIGILKKIVVIP